MPKPLNILLVEDNQAIADAYKAIFESEGNHVVCAFNYDSAIRIINENPLVAFDLFFADIDLVGDPTKGADKSGIYFARYARQVVPNVPIVGHSAYFDNDDILPEERAYFDEWFPKGIKTAEREVMFDRALRIAEERRKAKFAPTPSNSTPELVDSLDVPGSTEEFESLGYYREVVSPSETNGFMKPFSVWCRESEEGFELEVVGCPALLAWGGDKTEAYEHLFEFIHSNKDLLAEDDVRGSSLFIARFIREVVEQSEDQP